MTEYILTFPLLARPPLTANQRLHHFAKARITRDLREATASLARHAGIPPLGRCEVSLTWYVKDRRRRDADNIVPTLKAMCDGLVDAGVVVDDTPDLMVKHMPRIEYRSAVVPHFVLLVESTNQESGGSENG